MAGALLLSCEPFQPEGEFFVEIDVPAPTSTISLNSFDDEDTITIYDATTFGYSIKNLNRPLKEFKAHLNTELIHKSESATGTFAISDFRLVTGTYKLKVVLSMNAGTGSLADREGTEIVEVWREWTLIIDRAPPAAPLLKLSSENGFLKVSWDVFAKPSFLNYVFTTSGPGGNKTFGIIDPMKTSYIDSTYVGGGAATYQIAVNTKTGSAYSVILTVNDPQSLQVTLNPGDSTATLTWRRSRYPGAFLNAVISNQGQPVKTILDANDTTETLKMDFLFGLGLQPGITINARYPRPGYSPFTSSQSFNNPLNLPKVEVSQVFSYSQTVNAIVSYSTSRARFRRFDNTMKVVDSISGVPATHSIPHPGRFLYITESKGVAQINLITKEKKYVETKGFYGSPFLPNSISGADNGYVTYGLVDNTHAFDRRYDRGLIDINSGVLLWSSDGPFVNGGGQRSHIISDNGAFAKMNNSEFFTVDAGGLTPNPGSVNGFLSFRADNNLELITADFNGVYIKRADDFSTIRTLPHPDQTFPMRSYDPATKCIFYNKFGAREVYLLNIDTGEVTTIGAWSSGNSYAGGILFANDGYYVKIK